MCLRLASLGSWDYEVIKQPSPWFWVWLWVLHPNSEKLKCKSWTEWESWRIDTVTQDGCDSNSNWERRQTQLSIVYQVYRVLSWPISSKSRARLTLSIQRNSVVAKLHKGRLQTTSPMSSRKFMYTKFYGHFVQPAKKALFHWYWHVGLL